MARTDVASILSEFGVSESEASQLLDELGLNQQTIAFCFDTPPIMWHALEAALLQRAREPSFGPVRLVLGNGAFAEPGQVWLRVEHYPSNAAAIKALKETGDTEFTKHVSISDQEGRMLWNDQQMQEVLSGKVSYPVA